MLFKRADKGSVEAEKWLIAEYYRALGHLNDAGLRALTDRLVETCTFFPSIRECLDITRPKQGDFANPFYGSDYARLTDGPCMLGSGRPREMALTYREAGHE